jgi:processive 1,2-diacylglycerol beta-glucosyltransferase
MQPDLVIVHSPVGGGHKSAALATAEAARARGLSVEVLDTFEHAPRVFGQAYLAAHLTWQGTMPELYGSAYFASYKCDGALEPVRRGIDHVAWGGLVHRVVQLRPRAVLATHHLPLVVLARARRRGWLEAPLVGVVTDYGAHAVWVERGTDALCVPGGGALRDVVAHGFDAARAHLTGIPVRGAFEGLEDVRDPQADEPLRVLLTSGGFGVGPVQAVVRSFTGIGRVRLTIVCGRAAGLVRATRELVGQCGLDAEVLGFEHDMPARVADAHVVVGKAGGLTVSETLAAGRPMIIAGAVPGNEAINAKLVESGGAGVVARPEDVGPTVQRLREAHAIARMGSRARRLVFAHAADRVIDVALRAEREIAAAAPLEAAVRRA